MCVISIIHSLLIYIWFKTTHPYLHALFFPIPCPAAFGEVVDRCKLNQGREDKGIAHCHEPVHGSGIGHLRKGVSSTDAQGGHGKHSGDPWGGKENIRTHILLRENNVDEKPDSLFQRQKWFFLQAYCSCPALLLFKVIREARANVPQIHYTCGNVQARWL